MVKKLCLIRISMGDIKFSSPLLMKLFFIIILIKILFE